jgi:hypothetical protein
MEQDTNKEYLKKLLDFLKNRILSNPANAWFAKDLCKILTPVSDSRISDIHEQCIESILQYQAKEFYKDFVITDIKSQLISDFVKMEHWRRRNNIGEFGFAVFQQIECIINRISTDNTLSEVFRAMMDALCYVDGYNPLVSNRNLKSTYTIAQLLFMHDASAKSKETLSQQWVLDKFKSINYFICHKGCLTNSQFNQFVEENNLFGEIYALRNLNHRGNNMTEPEKKRLKNIYANPSRAFLSITSFLCWFVNGVNQGFPVSEELIEFAKTDFSNVRKPNIGPKVIDKIELKDDGRKRFK